LPIAIGTILITGTTTTVFGWLCFSSRQHNKVPDFASGEFAERAVFNVQNLFPALYGIYHATKITKKTVFLFGYKPKVKRFLYFNFAS